MVLIKWRNLLRRAWDERDPHQREWTIFELRLSFHNETSPHVRVCKNPLCRHNVPPGFDQCPNCREVQPFPAPERTPFEQAMIHFQQRASQRRIKHCQAEGCNGFTYFIAANPRYVYCSDECINWRQKQLNNDYYDRKGRKMRQSKRRKDAKKR